jgi:hypothetical protein
MLGILFPQCFLNSTRCSSHNRRFVKLSRFHIRFTEFVVENRIYHIPKVRIQTFDTKRIPPIPFTLELPKVIGNYNPDWGIVRLAADGSGTVQLVRETKGSDDLEKLRFQSEGRKLIAAKKYFAALGIDYRWVTGETPRYWEAEKPTKLF